MQRPTKERNVDVAGREDAGPILNGLPSQLPDIDPEETAEWLAGQLVTFVDLHPEFEVPVERLASWLARDDDD